MKSFLHHLIWALPASMGLGLALALLSGGTWWIGWMAYSALFLAGLLLLSALWRSEGSPRRFVVMVLLALFLRLAVGITLSFILPVYGNDTPVHQGGYIFRDAYTYDNQAWKLAASGDPLWKAFDRSHGLEEQYGGLTFLLGLFYRWLSPDMHRPWLIILLAAIAGSLGVALGWKAANKAWGEPTAWVVGWCLTLYPESLLAGASPIREPFLILFTAMAFLGLVNWRSNHRSSPWIWMVAGLLGAILFSPGVALALLVTLGVWIWLRGRDYRIHWWWLAVAGALVLLGLVFLGVLVGGTLQVSGGPLSNLVNWLKYSVNYGAYVTEQSSGWIQNVFDLLPQSLHLPFIILYGVSQPLLPAALGIIKGSWLMNLLGILRGLGWYTLLPFLIYSLRSAWKCENKSERLSWLWLWLVCWGWILLASARAGGDQWDNPRYRLILLLFQAALAAQALLWQRKTRDPWLGRLLAMEAVFLVLFGYWYLTRFLDWMVLKVHVLLIMGLIAFFCILIFVWGIIQDRKAEKRKLSQ